MSNKREVDEMLVAIMMKKLMEPVSNFQSYKDGIIDEKGKILDPKRGNDILPSEALALTLKRLMGGRVNYLRQLGNTLIMLKDEDLYKKLIRTNKVNPMNLKIALQKLIDRLKK